MWALGPSHPGAAEDPPLRGHGDRSGRGPVVDRSKTIDTDRNSSRDKCMHMYVCIYIYMCVCVCAYLYIYAHICTYSSLDRESKRFQEDSASALESRIGKASD